MHIPKPNFSPKYNQNEKQQPIFYFWGQYTWKCLGTIPNSELISHSQNNQGAMVPGIEPGASAYKTYTQALWEVSPVSKCKLKLFIC